MFLVQKLLQLSSLVPPSLFLEFVAGFLDATSEGLTKRFRKDYKMVRIGLEKRSFGGIVNGDSWRESPRPPRLARMAGGPDPPLQKVLQGFQWVRTVLRILLHDDHQSAFPSPGGRG
jgi:hypothetical protein